MKLLLVALFVLAVTTYHSTSYFINAASISSESFGNTLRQRLPANNNARLERSTEEDQDGEKVSGGEKRYCYNAPCGWAVYNPITRNIEYFMKNTCECPEGYKCVRYREDLSASAYVYRCRQNTTESDIVLEQETQ